MRDLLWRLATLASPAAPPTPELESAAVSDFVGQPVSAMYDLGLLGAVAATAYKSATSMHQATTLTTSKFWKNHHVHPAASWIA
jgi:hypothetical protein